MELFNATTTTTQTITSIATAFSTVITVQSFQPSADSLTAAVSNSTPTISITTLLTTAGTRNESVHSRQNLPLGASLLFINFCIIVFNSLMIAVIIRFRTKNAIDIFVLALATTDLIKGLIPVPMSVYIYLTEWYLKEGKKYPVIFWSSLFQTFVNSK